MNRKSNVWEKATVIVFFLLLTGFSTAARVLPDVFISKTERRSLVQKPTLSIENVLNGTYMSKLETYFLEQFAGRDFFRSLKAETETRALGKADSDDYYKIKDGIYKLDPKLNEKNIIRTAKAFSRIKKEAFPEVEAYFAIIPDKNYFVAEANGYPAYDYERLNELMQEQMKDVQYIDIYDLLELEDYYRTDLHWKQECIVDVAEELFMQMNMPTDGNVMKKDAVEKQAMQSGYSIEQDAQTVDKMELGQYEERTAKEDFYGGYAGASAFLTEPEELHYLTNDTIESAFVYDYETKQETTIYAVNKLEGTDAYDFYLGGARALLTVKNPSLHNGKKMLLFRDSFGSSIAPLFLEKYEEITLVDFRYVSENYLVEILDMTEYDNVLFLYSTTVLNHSDSMKINEEKNIESGIYDYILIE